METEEYGLLGPVAVGCIHIEVFGFALAVEVRVCEKRMQSINLSTVASAMCSWLA